MKGERLQSETDQGPEAHGHDAAVSFVITEDALSSKFPAPVKRTTEKGQTVELDAEAVKR